MTKISKPIVFFGTEDFSLLALKALVEADFSISAVITKPDSPQGRGHKITPPVIKTYAAEQGIQVWQPTKMSEIAHHVKELGDPIGVLVSYGKIIPKTIIDLFTHGIINVHPSLLPRYRGPSPIETALLNRDDVTGVTIMQLSPEMDAGPIYKQTRVPLRGDETAEELYSKLGKTGSHMLIELLPKIIDGSATPQPQDDAAATYCHLIKKSDAIIDWNEPAKSIEAKIRALHLWPKARTKFLVPSECIILEAEVIDNDMGLKPSELSISKSLIIGCGDGSISIKRIQPLGKKEMPIQAFLAGYGASIQSTYINHPFLNFDE